MSRRKSIDFIRREEEREVAKSVEAGTLPDATSIAQAFGLVTSAQMLERRRRLFIPMSQTIRLEDFPEEEAFRERRLQLEAELREMDRIWKEACEYKPPARSTSPKTVR